LRRRFEMKSSVITMISGMLMIDDGVGALKHWEVIPQGLDWSNRIIIHVA